MSNPSTAGARGGGECAAEGERFALKRGVGLRASALLSNVECSLLQADGEAPVGLPIGHY